MNPFKVPIKILAGPALCLVFLFVQACSTTPERTRPQTQNPWEEMDLVWVPPFQNMTKIYGEGEHVRSPFSEKYYIAGKIEADGEDYLNGKLMDLLERRADIKIMGPDDAQQEIQEGSNRDAEDVRGMKQLMEAGRKVGADGVLIGYIYRYSERVGISLSVSSPASVVFELFLISTKTSSVQWSAGFSETQKSLSEDLTQIKKYFQRGPKWITAKDMAGSALTAIIGEIPER